MPTITGGGSFTGGGTIILPSATGREPSASNASAQINAWDLAYAQPESNTSNLWDITTAKFQQWYNTTPDIMGSTGGLRGVHLGNSGTKMYATTNGVDRVWEWDLTNPYDVSSADFTTSFNTNTYETNNRSVTFKPDGTKMYTVGFQNDTADQYDLSDSWNVASASHVTDFSVAAYEANPESIEFKPDGTKMFVLGTSGDDINEYTLSTAWDLSTATYSQSSGSTSSFESSPKGMTFKPDGTKVWIVGSSTDSVDEYDLSTAWDVSTLSHAGNDISISLNPEAIWFKPDGSAFYVAQNGNYIYQWIVGQKQFFLRSEESTPNTVFFKTDGTKMYICGQNGDEINEYDLSTAWDVETATYNQNFSLSSQDGTPMSMYIKSDGTKFYMSGSSGDDINEYDFGTAWDVSTLSYSQNFSVSAKETHPEGLDFKPDGTKMYICGNSSDSVHEYDLSTAWDISTASFNQSFAVNTVIVNPTEIRFESNGDKMFVVGRGTNLNDAIYEYALSTSWDITTASFTRKLNVPENTPTGLFFKPDGEKMYLVGSAEDTVFQYEFTS